MIAAAALGWVALLAVVTMWRDRRWQGELESLRARVWVLDQEVEAHDKWLASLEQDTHNHRPFNHEPAVARLLSGEVDASERRMTGGA